LEKIDILFKEFGKLGFVGKISQKSNENFVMGYTFNLCENYISIVILNQNIKNQ